MTFRVSGELQVLLARGISKSLVTTAMRYAPSHGISACEYLVQRNLLSEAAVYSAFAEHCDVPFLPKGSFRVSTVNDVPVHLGSFNCGPILVGIHLGLPVYVICPQYSRFERVKDHLDRHPEIRRQIRIVEPSAMALAAEIMNSPASDLECRFPSLSARREGHRLRWGGFALGVTIALMGMTLPAMVWFWIFMMFMAIACLVMGGARIASAVSTWHDPMVYRLPEPLNSPYIIWPGYTVLVPLYREANVVPELVASLAQLDYPSDSLQILFLVESDDRETLRALRGERLAPAMNILVVPDGYPRTKPRALSYGLAEATGDYITIFDAEDRPEPDQLKKAAVLFSQTPETLACLQARLTIDNANDGFLSRQFAFEYACLFDQMLPWLSRLGIPFPLGGTSNHFRKRALDQVGGWDRFNVTEDADLGVRLARFGLRLGVMTSSTYEEAPITLSGWLAQRTRWYKGWLQTIGVHMRQPAALLRDVGPRNFLALAALFAGALALIALHPVFFVLMFAYLIGLVPLPTSETGFEAIMLGLSFSGSAIGYLGSVIAIWKAGDRRRFGPQLFDMVSLPLYWFFTGIAFYRAVWELFAHPYRWNKTSHGQARKRVRVNTG